MMAAAQPLQIILKIDDDLRDRIEHFSQKLSDSQPAGLKISRAQAIRVLIHRGLDAFEAEEERSA
jgi:hypothetical protein